MRKPEFEIKVNFEFVLALSLYNLFEGNYFLSEYLLKQFTVIAQMYNNK